MNKIIARFAYQKTEYVIKFLKDKTIGFYKVTKNGLDEHLSIKEFQIVSKVFSTLQVHKEASFYEHKKLGSRNYNVFYDKVSQNFFWISLNGDYSIEDNIKLNFKYNHDVGMLFNGSKRQIPFQDNSMYKKLVKIGNTLVSVFVSTALVLNLLSGCTVSTPEQLSEPEIAVVETIDIEEEKETTIQIYNFDNLKANIDNNPNLSDEAKDLIKATQFVFDEYHEHMDIDLISSRLKTLEMKFQKNHKNKDVSSYYSQSENKITFGFDNLDETPLEEFYHEFFHVLQDGRVPFTGELSNSFFTKNVILRLYLEGKLPKERFLLHSWAKDVEEKILVLNTEQDWLYMILAGNSFEAGYGSYIGIFYILAEIMPKETLSKYQFNPSSTETLKSALIAIDPDHTTALDRANTLINSINDLREYDPSTNQYTYYTDGVEIFATLDYYYELKTGRTISEDVEMMAILSAQSYFSLSDEALNTGIPLDQFKLFKEQVGIRFTRLYMINKSYLWDIQPNSVFVWMDPAEGIKVLNIDEELQQIFSENVNLLNSDNSRTH